MCRERSDVCQPLSCRRLGGLERLVFFFFNDTATTEIYTLSLHDALSDLRAFGGCLGTERR